MQAPGTKAWYKREYPKTLRIRRLICSKGIFTCLCLITVKKTENPVFLDAMLLQYVYGAGKKNNNKKNRKIKTR